MRALLLLLPLLLLLMAALPALAQDTPPADLPPDHPMADGVVTFDEVNAIAAKMYCPVCEMEPLDTCGAVTCVRWREEIREQLEAGYTEDQVIANFVDRYGDRVVGVPRDTGLFLLALLGPVLGAVTAGFVGWRTFRRWQATRSDDVGTPPALSTNDADLTPGDDPYRARLEQDLGR